MTDLHGRPTAPELLAAAEDFLRDELLPGLEGPHRFHLRVTVNVLAMVRRELALGEEQRRRHADRLRALGVEDEAALAGLIRAGSLTAAREREIRAAVLESVRDKLAVANPGYLP